MARRVSEVAFSPEDEALRGAVLRRLEAMRVEIDDVDSGSLGAALEVARDIYENSPRRADFCVLWMFATARSVRDGLNPCALQTPWAAQGWRTDLAAFSMRTLCDALGRWAPGHGVWIGTDSIDPLNSGNYNGVPDLFTKFKIAGPSEVDSLRPKDRRFLALMMELADISKIEAERLALACMAVARDGYLRRVGVDFGSSTRSFSQLTELVDALLRTHSERGKWGQAFVAAALRAAGASDVQCRGVHTSRNLAADVRGFFSSGAAVVCEARQKPEEDGPMAFGNALREKRNQQAEGTDFGVDDLTRGFYIDLPPSDLPARSDFVLRRVLAETETLVVSLSGVDAVVRTFLVAEPTTATEFAARFPAMFDEELLAQNVENIDFWRDAIS